VNLTAGSFGVGDVTIGNLTVSYATVLGQEVTAGALCVTGGALLQSTLTVSGATALDSSLTVTGASILNEGVTTGALFVTGGSVLNQGVTAGTLLVTGSSIFQSTVTSGSIFVSSGDLTVTDGSIIFNSVNVSPSMADIVKERNATVGNGVSSAQDVVGFAFDNAIARTFDAVVSVTITNSNTTGNKYAYYNLKGVQKLNNWVLNSSFVGDVTGLTFSINNSGQLQYTSTEQVDFVSGLVKFRALTTTVEEVLT
jgi:hypothetical protein